MATAVFFRSLDELRTFHEGLPRRGLLVLTNSDGVPWKCGFSSSWNKALKGAKTAGLHGGTAATRMFIGDLSPREIAQTLGWSEAKVERLIERYVSQDEVQRDRVRRSTRTPAEQIVKRAVKYGPSHGAK